MESIRVLHINAGSRIFGGVSAFCLNIYRKIDREKVQFDFLTPNISTYEQFRTEIESYGGRIYQLGINSSTNKGKIKLYFALKGFLRNHKYDIIHINSGVLLFNCIVKAACKRYSTAKIFVHSHSNGGRSERKERFSEPLKRFLAKDVDVLLACSTSAAQYMFHKSDLKKVEIINNGIDVEKFKLNLEMREKLRNELNLREKFVIGHVGRFTKEKNQYFLIDLLRSIREEREDVVLLLIGEGELQEETREYAKKQGVLESVLFLGARKDVNDIYQVIDVFVLPSKYEGFGIVNIEAETSGLKCIVSDVVPETVNVTGSVVRLSLNDSIGKWKKEVLNVSKERRDMSKLIVDAGFDINTSATKLTQLYIGARGYE